MLLAINAHHPEPRKVRAAVKALSEGGVIGYPTDTVYGIGCDPYDDKAIDRIFQAKNRSNVKPLTLHLASAAEFLEYARDNALAALQIEAVNGSCFIGVK